MVGARCKKSAPETKEPENRRNASCGVGKFPLREDRVAPPFAGA